MIQTMALVLLSLGVLGHGQFVWAQPGGFCEIAYDWVCSAEEVKEHRSREERIDAIGQTLRTRALQAAAKRFGLDENLTLAELATMRPKSLRQEVHAKYYGFLRRFLRVYLKRQGLERDLSFSAIKSDMVKIVRERPQYQAAQKRELIAVLESVRIVTLDEVLFSQKAPVDLAETIRECGEDGLEDNAYADTVGGKRIVIICPGALLASVEYALDQGLGLRYAVAGLIMTLAHEIGHHIDAESFPDIYKDDLRCVGDKFGTELLAEVPAYSREISADFWGNEVLGHYLNRAPKEQRPLLLRGALEDLCESEDDQDHPRGEFRINRLVRASRAVSQAMRCEAPAQDQAGFCSLP